MAVIYQITNMVNGKYYIGSADSFARREWQHKYDLKRGAHKNPRLQAAWNKYGPEAFVFEILEELAEGASQLQIEDTYLVQHVGKPECYNINPGAELPRLGLKHTAASKQLVSANRKGKHAGEAHYRFGQTVSAEVRKKIGDAQRGKPKAPGRQVSPEGMAKIRAAAEAGRYASFKGKQHSEEAKAKMRKPVHAVLPDRSERIFSGLTEIRDTMGVSIATTIRACKSGKPIASGAMAGWVLAYQGETVHAPEIPEEFLTYPRSRTQAKAEEAKFYFTGLPCEHGHIALRRAKGTCVECAKLEGQKANERRRLAKAAQHVL